MSHRLFRVVLLLFAAAWFGVVVPGHRRGQILLPGAKSCCAAAMPLRGAAPSGPTREPLPNRAACAICHFMAMLDLPVSIQQDAPVLGFSHISDCIFLDQVPALVSPPPVFPRGPPIA